MFPPKLLEMVNDLACVPFYAFKSMSVDAFYNRLIATKLDHCIITPSATCKQYNDLFLVASFVESTPPAIADETKLVTVSMRNRNQYTYIGLLDELRDGKVIRFAYDPDAKRKRSKTEGPIYVWIANLHESYMPSEPQVTTAEVTEMIVISQEETVLKEVTQPEPQIVTVEAIDYRKLERIVELRNMLRKCVEFRDQRMMEIDDISFINHSDKLSPISATELLHNAFGAEKTKAVLKDVQEMIQRNFTEQALTFMEEMKSLGVRFSPEEELTIRG